MGLRRVLEGKGRIDAGLDVAGAVVFQQGVHFATQKLELIPQVTDVDAPDRFVVVHQGHGAPLRNGEILSQDVPPAHRLPGRHVGEPERHQVTHRFQKIVSRLPVAPAQRIQDDVHALPAGEPTHLLGVVLRAVIDGVVAALLSDHVVLPGGGRAVDGHVPDGFTQLKHRGPHPAGRHVNQHRLPRLEVGHLEEHVVGGDVIHRQGRPLLEGHPLRHGSGMG